MKILFLTSNEVTRPLIEFLSRENTVVFDHSTPVDWVISYNYKQIIKKPFIDKYKGKIINLHISYLPFNKGADPIFWSLVEDTPSGVTIHQIDEGIDTGDILVQKYVPLDDEDTLKTAYEKLHREIQKLFIDNWEKIKKGEILPQKQRGIGTYHRASDKYNMEVGNLKRLRLGA